MRRLALCFTPILLLACNGGPDEPDPLQTEHEGYYVISHWTLNEDGCDSEGESLLESGWGTEFYVRDFPRYLLLESCTDREACRNRSLMIGNDFPLWRAQVSEGSDDAGWRGRTIVAGEDASGVCGGMVADHEVQLGASVHAKSRFKYLTLPDTYECSERVVEAAAERIECAELIVLDGDYDGPLEAELPDDDEG